MNFRYYIFSGTSWVECRYDAYSKWNGKKYKSPYNVLDDLNSGKIQVEEPKTELELKQYYVSGMSLVDGKWMSCGWRIEATSFVDAARKAEADKTFRVHSISDCVMH